MRSNVAAQLGRLSTTADWPNDHGGEHGTDGHAAE
jgi:hypothetical protein